MSALGARTKKVTTYGRKKTQIISVHSDLSAPVPSSPLAAKTKRPILQSKLSNDITNLPATPRPQGKSGKVDRGKGKTVDLPFPQSSPEIIFKARKVTRPGKVVIPRSPSISPAKTPKHTNATPIKATSKTGRQVFDGVVIPIRSTQKKAVRLGDLSKKLAEVTIEDKPSQSPTPSVLKDTAAKSRASLESLVDLCSSSTIQPFSTFLSSDALPTYSNIVKVGEASYSEVFGLTCASQPASDTGEQDVRYVLKVIPLLSASDKVDEGAYVPLPDFSEPEDVRREIQLTKRMGQVPGGGFVEFIGAYVVEGAYPSMLLNQWDEFKSALGSASVRPSSLPESQKYCLLVLSNAGQDLEAYKFQSTTGWTQAAGVFWQIASALARAEQWTQFEHRDLHEGQILVSARPSVDKNASKEENYLNPSFSGVQTTIIDFGLSRLSMPSTSTSNTSQKGAVWTALPEEVYEGKGAQWDLYRAMRDRIESDDDSQGKWEDFHPVTNVMWLHYILRYMIGKLRPPKPSTTSRKGTQAQKAVHDRLERAYTMLTRVEKVLGWSVDFASAGQRRGLRGAQDTFLDEKLESAEAVLHWGTREGWVA